MRFESLPIYAGLATAYTASTIDTLHLIVNTPRARARVRTFAETVRSILLM